MTCKHCGTEIAQKALICFKCGKATSEPRIAPPVETSLFARRHGRRGRRLVAVIVALLALGALAVWFLG